MEFTSGHTDAVTQVDDGQVSEGIDVLGRHVIDYSTWEKMERKQ